MRSRDEKPEWNESFDEWVKRYWGKYPPFHPDELEGKWKKWKEQIKEEEEEEEMEEKNEINDPTSTLGSSRNPTDPCTSEDTTEPIDLNRCLRPLQRARERREARLQKERDAHAVNDPDLHDPGSQRSRASCDQEQDRAQLKFFLTLQGPFQTTEGATSTLHQPGVHAHYLCGQ